MISCQGIKVSVRPHFLTFPLPDVISIYFFTAFKAKWSSKVNWASQGHLFDPIKWEYSPFLSCHPTSGSQQHTVPSFRITAHSSRPSISLPVLWEKNRNHHPLPSAAPSCSLVPPSMPPRGADRGRAGVGEWGEYNFQKLVDVLCAISLSMSVMSAANSPSAGGGRSVNSEQQRCGVQISRSCWFLLSCSVHTWESCFLSQVAQISAATRFLPESDISRTLPSAGLSCSVQNTNAKCFLRSNEHLLEMTVTKDDFLHCF